GGRNGDGRREASGGHQPSLAKLASKRRARLVASNAPPRAGVRVPAPAVPYGEGRSHVFLHRRRCALTPIGRTTPLRAARALPPFSRTKSPPVGGSTIAKTGARLDAGRACGKKSAIERPPGRPLIVYDVEFNL